MAGKREIGGAQTLVLAFMALAIPLVTASLSLASTLSVDSRVKTRIAQSQYSVLGATQHALYRLAHEVGYADGLAIGAPDSYTVELNGREVAVTVEKFSEPPGDTPPPNADSSRRLQALKQVTPSSAPPDTPTTFSYTITVENRDDQAENLRKIHDELPNGFSYLPGSTSGVTTADPSISGQQLTWNLAQLQIVLQPGQSAFLSFSAQASVEEGTYCNEAWVEPGDKNTTSGKTARITVGSPPNDLCQGPTVELTKTVTPGTAAAYAAATFTYTITIRNAGTAVLNMSQIRDWLPQDGFLYVPGSTSGDITTADPSTSLWQGRQRLDWNFNPKQQLQPGESRALTFQAEATLEPGDYYNEVWGTFDEFTSPAYTWPTARVEVMAVFTITAIEGGSTAWAEVWAGVSSWAITRFLVSR